MVRKGVPSKVRSAPAGAGRIPRNKLRPPLSPVPGGNEAPGYFKATFWLPPHRPPRRCPRQAWSEAGDGVMRLHQSPPAAPRQPRGLAKVSPAAGYCRAPSRNPPAVTWGQAPLTPSPIAPSGLPRVMLLTGRPVPRETPCKDQRSLHTPPGAPQRHPALSIPLCNGGVPFQQENRPPQSFLMVQRRVWGCREVPPPLFLLPTPRGGHVSPSHPPAISTPPAPAATHCHQHAPAAPRLPPPHGWGSWGHPHPRSPRGGRRDETQPAATKVGHLQAKSSRG